MFEDLKKKLAKKKLERKKEKELLKQIEEEEKEIEASLPKEKKPGIDEFLDLVLFDDDEEYKSYLTEKELEDYKKEKEKNKKYAFTVTGMIFGIMIVITIGLYVVFKFQRPDIYKVTLPIIEKYYQEKYNEKPKIDTIEPIVYYEWDENNNRKTIETGIVVAKTKNGKHIVTVNDNQIGDDISIVGYQNEYLERVQNLLGDVGIIAQEVNLYYKPYYGDTFNRYEEHINALPSGRTIDELKQDGNLTVTYRLVYSGELDISVFKGLLYEASDDSSFYLIKLENGLPKRLITIDKNNTFIMDITATVEKDENVTYYQLDTEENNTASLKYTEVASADMASANDYDFNFAFKIEKKDVKRYSSRDDPDEKVRSDAYLLKFKAGKFNPDKMAQMDSFKSSRGREELKLDKYKDVIFVSGGGNTYMISEAKELLLAQKSEKKSFLCKIGIC